MGEAGGADDVGDAPDEDRRAATDRPTPGPERPATLLAWTFGAFHAALLVVLVVTALYLLGLAGDQLAALDTSVGVVAYLYLWGVAWWTNRRMLDDVGTGLLAGQAAPTVVFVEAAKWGGVAGFLVFLPLLAIGIALFVGAGGLSALPFVVVGAAIGSALSAGVGVLAGVVFALLDLVLLRAARGWLSAEPAPPSADA